MAANLVDLFGESEDDNDDFETDFKVGPGEDEHAQGGTAALAMSPLLSSAKSNKEF